MQWRMPDTLPRDPRFTIRTLPLALCGLTDEGNGAKRRYREPDQTPQDRGQAGVLGEHARVGTELGPVDHVAPGHLRAR